MAEYKTPKPPKQFNSIQAKGKWASLENQAGLAMDKIAKGQATTTDIQKVSSTLKQLSSVASTVFNEAVDAAQQTALVVKDAGNLQITEGLTAFEAALNSALQVSFKDTIQQIKDIFELDLLGQTEELTKTIGGSFADLYQRLPPKDLPTTNDLLAANDLLAEQLDKNDKETWLTKADDLVDRMYLLFNDTLRNLKVNPAVNSGANKFAKGRRHGMNPYNLGDSLADKAQALVGPVRPNGWGTDVTDVTSTPTTSVNMAPASAEKATAVNEAQTKEDKWSSIMEKLDAYLDSRQDSKREDPAEKETKKADSWWKSFKENFTGGSKKGKKGKGDTSIMKTLADFVGKGLLSMLLVPELWRTVEEKLESAVAAIPGLAKTAWTDITALYDKYVTWDNIKDIAGKVWNFVTEEGGEFLTWVKKLIGWDSKKSTLENAGDLAKKGADVVGTGVKYIADATGIHTVKDATNVASKGWSAIEHGATSLWNGAKSMVEASNAKPSTSAASSAGSSSTSSTYPTTLNVGVNRNSLLTGSRTSSAQTTVMNSGSVNIMPSATYGVGPAAAGGTTTAQHQGAQGSSKVNATSFGFHSSVDDSLLLMNSGMLF